MCVTTVILLSEVRPKSELHDLLHAIVAKAISQRPQMKSLLFTEVGNVAPLHVSLTRPLILWTTEKEAFLTAFKNAVEEIQYPVCGKLLIEACRRSIYLLRMWNVSSTMNRQGNFSS